MDAVDLREFYATPCGRVAQRMVRNNLRQMWPDVSGQNVLGIGYPTPYLGLFRHEAQRTVAAMPARQGVLHWPPSEPGLTTLVQEKELPFADLSMDRVLMVHAIESTERLRHMLREAWRVMTESGRLLIVAPNRRGLWARMEMSPFAHGQPYSPAQLSRLLRDNMFTPVRSQVGLYMPPSSTRLMLGSAPAFEQIGRRFFPAFGGVVIIEAAKEIYAGQMAGERQTRRAFALAPPGSTNRAHRGLKR
ncbi:methyltransferase domain-containing protein [Magnetovibrio sp. PR-2]|uniref:class I SAM-dependent methyltransferase n=1 Tax=Magnetovibrio sp. PR-2 TaxID=3120356 RepID=UPI002FCE39DB